MLLELSFPQKKWNYKIGIFLCFAKMHDTARQTLWPNYLWHDIGTWCSCRNMAWSKQRPDKSQMYVNKLCMLVGPCPAVPTWPEEYSHISVKLCTNCLKLSGHTGSHDRSRQDVVYLYKTCAQNAWTCPAKPAVTTGQNNLSRQAVPQAHQSFCSSHVVPLLCCAVARHIRHQWAVL